MRKQNSIILLLLFAFTSLPALALDQNDEDALKDTHKLLGDQKRMEQLGRTDAEAGKALNQLKQLTGNDPKAQAEMQGIAASVFDDMVRKNNGDTVSINDQLQKALADPKAFMNGLSPEQQARIKGLAAEIDQKNAGRAPASVK